MPAVPVHFGTERDPVVVPAALEVEEPTGLGEVSLGAGAVSLGAGAELTR
jgi:hypothetical protein